MDLAPIVESLNGGLIVLTTAGRGERSGCLIGFHSQCSIDPPRYAVWLSKLNHTYDAGALAEYVAIHFLTKDDHDLAEVFGGTTGDTHDKFASVEWTQGPHGLPLLTSCSTVIIARRTAYVDVGGDHVCLVCEPIDGEANEFDPLRLADVADIEPGHPSQS